MKHCKAMRQSFMEGIFDAEHCTIPKDRRFVVQMPCWEAHPGVCVTRDRQDSQVMKAGNTLQSLVFADKHAEGTFEIAEYPRPGLHWVPRVAFLCLAYKRGAKPKLAIFAKYVMDEDGCLTIARHEGVAVFVAPAGSMKAFFGTAVDVQSVGRLECHVLEVCDRPDDLRVCIRARLGVAKAWLCQIICAFVPCRDLCHIE